MSDCDKLREKTMEELAAMSVDLLKELAKLRFQKSMGEAVQSHRYGAIRRERARIKTVMNEKRAQQ